MSLTVTKGEGLTVITVSSDPKSKWPVLCQILASLCCSPVCFVSQKMKGKLTNVHTALGEVWPVSPVGSLKSITSICIMSLTVTKGEGLTVITVSSDPKSKWPVLCQILASLCCSPVCFVSQKMKGKLTNVHTALGTMQIIVGVINIVFGILLQSVWVWNTITESKAGFWIGGVVLVVGIVTILGAKFPSPCLMVIAMTLNIVSGALAITAVVLYSVDLAKGNDPYCDTDYYYSSYYTPATPSPEKIRRTEICMQYKYLIRMIVGGLDIMMIVLSVLQLCVTISFCVLTGKALCKKDEDAESVEDPELHKPLLEDVAVAPAC